MLKAKDVMNRKVTTVSPETTLIDAVKLLLAEKISGMPVIDAGEKLVGIISEKDILNFAFSGNIRQTRVKEAMSKEVISFSSETEIDTISLAISENKFRRIPIVDGETLVGIISRRDIIKILLSEHYR